jgi:hypothetical protein
LVSGLDVLLWHYEQSPIENVVASCHVTMAEAIALAKELKDMPALGFETVRATSCRTTARYRRLLPEAFGFAPD